MSYQHPFSLNPQEHEQLLRAIFCQGMLARNAYQAWRAKLDWNQIEATDKQMIPLLYNNLLRLDIQDPLMGRFKGIYRRTWYKNQLLLDQTKILLQAWQADNVEAICLPDISLAFTYYANLGLRPIEHNFLVRSTKVRTAIRSLQQGGWSPINRHLPENLTTTTHVRIFTDRHGNQLNLYWHLLPKSLYWGGEEIFWKSKVAIELKDTTIDTLELTDQVLYLCVPITNWHTSQPLRVADAITLLTQAQDEIDWPRLCALCQKHHLVFPVHNTLQYLADIYDVPIPTDVLETLAQMAVDLRHHQQPRRLGKRHWMNIVARLSGFNTG